MEILDAIKERRSIRRFKQKSIGKDIIERIISYAAYAPSWKNSQTSRYIAVLDSKVKDRLASECLMNFQFNINTLNSAPAVIALLTQNKRSGFERDGSFSTGKGEHWQSFDAGIAAQTFCLSAHAHGLGTVIMGIYDEACVKEVLSVPEGFSVSALIAIGYPDEAPVAPPRKDNCVLLSYID